MARIDLKNQVIHAKLVYYGPGLCGKTTNLEYVAKNLAAASGHELMSLATEGDRTIFFDFLPLDLGKLRGLDVQFKLYTVPGQVRYNETRKMVLKNVDGVVFVADSQELMMDANLESLDNLYSNLRELGIDDRKLAIVLQYNKRDLPTAVPVSVLDKALNGRGYPTFTASARVGEGVPETLKEACVRVLKSLSADLEGRQAPSRDAPHAPPSPAPQAPPKEIHAAAASPPAAVKGAPATPPSPARAPERLEPVRTSDHEASMRSLLAESSQVLGALREHLGQLRRTDAAKPVAGEEPALRRLVEPLATKGDIAALSGRLDGLAAGMKSAAPAESAVLEKIAQLVPKNEDASSLRDAIADLGKNVAQICAAQREGLAALEERVGRVPKHVEEALAESAKSVQDLRGDVRALREARPAASIDPELLERIATKSDLAALERRLSELPGKSEIDALKRSTSDLLDALKGVESRLAELASAERARREDAERRPPSEWLARVATKEDLQGLERRLAETPDRTALAAAVGSAPSRAPAEAPSTASPVTPPASVSTPAEDQTGQVYVRPTVAAPAVDAEAIAHVRPTVLAPAADQAAHAHDAPDHAPPAAPAETAPAAPTPPAAEPAQVARAHSSPPSSSAPVQVARAHSSPPSSSALPPNAQEPIAAASAGAALPPQPAATPSAPEKPTAATVDPALLGDPRHQNAARVARVMVADLYLYQKEAVELGIRNGDFFERNKDALADMHTTYASRVPEDVRAQGDYLDKAIRDFIAKKRLQLGLA